MKRHHAVWQYVGPRSRNALSLILGMPTQDATLIQPRLSGDLVTGAQHKSPAAGTAVTPRILVVLGATLTAIQQNALGIIGEQKVYSTRFGRWKSSSA